MLSLAGAYGRPTGYKIGLTSPRMQQMCGIDRPVCGRILEGRIHRSGARVAVGEFVHLGIESELCVGLCADLPPRSRPYDTDDVAASVGTLAAAFELVDDRHADYGRLDARSLIADNAWNAGVVLGSAVQGATVSAARAGKLRGTLFIDGVRTDEGCSGDALGHPFAALAWLANHLKQRGSSLRAGDLVMTGSIVTTRFPAPGEHHRFELAGLPAVELFVA